MAGQLLTRRELAEHLSTHMMTVTKWEREGLPIAQRGSKGRPSFYREVDVRAWLQLREEAAKQPGAVNLVQERARRERAQAILAEQAYLIRNRDLLVRDEVEKTWSAEVAAVRAKLLSWSTGLADALHRAAVTDGIPGIERVLEDATRDVLLELASPDRPLPEAPPSNDGEAVAA
jgi:hypothetical protein